MEPVKLLRVIEIDPSADPRWDQFLRAHPLGSVYLTRGWLKALSDEYRHPAICLACEDGFGRLLAILPLVYTRGLPFHLGGCRTNRRLSSLPRSSLGGPLSTDGAATRMLLSEAVDRCRQDHGMHLQLKTDTNDLEGLCEGLICTPWRNSYILSLPSHPAAVRFGNNVAQHRIKWAVNKAVKLGVEVHDAETEDELEQWYPLYLHVMRRVFEPPRPFRFFQSLWKSLHPSGMMRLLLASRCEGGRRKLLAGSIFLLFGQTVTYAFTGCAPAGLACHSNDLVHWHSIHDACRAGFSRYDFGEVPDDHPQLATFKGKWGAEPCQRFRYYFPPEGYSRIGSSSPASVLQRIGSATWRRLPLSATAVLGDWVYAFL